MHKTINEGQCGVLVRRGITAKELAPGRHRYARILGNERITVVNIKSTTYVSETQEYATKDNLVVRFFIRVQSKVTNASRLLKLVDYATIDELHSRAVSDAARAYIASHTLDELLDAEVSLDNVIAKGATSPLAEVGITLESVSPISILIPRSLKAAFEAKVNARKKAEADLEEARGRTATLRHLANAADLVENRPVLLQLLLGQKARNVQFNFDETKKK